MFVVCVCVEPMFVGSNQLYPSMKSILQSFKSIAIFFYIPDGLNMVRFGYCFVKELVVVSKKISEKLEKNSFLLRFFLKVILMRNMYSNQVWAAKYILRRFSLRFSLILERMFTTITPN